jgi:hypothetical protein
VQPSAFKTRFVDGGLAASFPAGRIGRRTSSPRQFGQTPCSTSPAQSAQYVHSKLHIIASRLSAGRSRSQHSQFGLSSSIVAYRIGS